MVFKDGFLLIAVLLMYVLWIACAGCFCFFAMVKWHLLYGAIIFL